MNITRRRAMVAAAGCAASMLSGLPYAQSGPIRMVVPYAAGGSTDLIGRALADFLTTRLGQPVIVINQPGGGGSLGAAVVARAPADGRTLLMGTNGTQAINPTLFTKLPYDAAKDFVPVSLVATVPLLLVVPASSSIKALRQLAETAHANQPLSFGSAGVGSSGHLAGEILNIEQKLKAVHIPYKGDGPAVVDLIGGTIDFLFANMPAAVNQVRAGQIRALAVTSSTRSPELPDVPTVVEAGFPNLRIDPWYGILVPHGTNGQIVMQLNKDINDGLRDPQVRQRLEVSGAMPGGSTPQRFAEIIAFDTKRFAPVIKASGARAD